MKLPKRLKIKDTDTSEMKEVKQTVNDLLDFHYHVHNTSAGKHFHPKVFKGHKGKISDTAKALRAKVLEGHKDHKGEIGQAFGGGGC